MKWNKNIKFIWLAIFIIFSMPLLSQDKAEEYYGFYTQTWIDDNTILYSNRFESIKIDLKTSNKQFLSIDQTPVSESDVKQKLNSGEFSFLDFPTIPFYCEDSYYYIYYKNKLEKTKKEEKNLAYIKKFINSKWEDVTSLKFDNNRHKPLIFPLKNGKWFALNAGGMDDAFGKHIDSFFFIMKNNDDGILEYFDHHDHGLGKLYENIYIINSISGPSPKIFTDDFLIICVERYGLFWSISLENGQVKGPIKLYSRLSDESILKNEVLRPVINLQAKRDGTILVAARLEDNVLGGSEIIRNMRGYSNQILSGINAENALITSKGTQRIDADIYTKFPFVSWFEFTPSTLRFKKLSPPPFGAREMIHSAKEFRDFMWINDTNDNVRFLKRDLSEFKIKEMVKPAKPVEKKGGPTESGG